MAPSFAEVLEIIRPWISKALIDGQGWERMLALGRGLPADVANYWCAFEFRLQDPSPEADLSISIWSHGLVARHYVNRGKAADANAADVAFAELLQESERDGSFLSRVIGGVILEYDLAAESSPRLPGIFLAPDELWDHGYRGHTNPGLLTAVLAAATARPECDEQRRAVETLFRALPASASIPYAGVFPGRGSDAIRLLIAGIEPAGLPSLLERANWPGSPGAVAAAVSEYCDLTPCITVALDVGRNGISARLGLEMFQSPKPTRRREDSPEVWLQLIGRLVKRDLCLPEKAAGLQDAADLALISDPASGLRTWRGINHIKIALHGDQVEAKAYVFIERPWLTMAEFLRVFR